MFTPAEIRAARMLEAVLARYSEYLARAAIGRILTGTMPSDKATAEAQGVATRTGGQAIGVIVAASWGRAVGRFEFTPSGLPAIVAERQRDWARKMAGARNVLDGVVNSPEVVRALEVAENFDTATRAGRRTIDWVRTAKIDSVLEGYLAESPVAKGSQLLQDQLRFFSEGKLKFPLQIRSVTARAPFVGLRYQSWDVRNYAEMAALTTAREGEQLGEFAAAKELGSNLVKMPNRGKDYRALGDFVCARLNDKVFSLIPNDPDGFPYLWGPAGLNRSPDEYVTAHPRCSHVGRAVTRLQAVRERDGRRAA